MSQTLKVIGALTVACALLGSAGSASAKIANNVAVGAKTGGYEPWVWWKQRPRPGLALNAYASVTFKKTGKWFTGGLHPKDSHSPFTGQKIDVQGGFYDTPYHNNRREFMVKTFRFKGQAREAWCKRFDAVHKP